VTKLRLHLSISLDGYVAGPNQTEEEPLGVGGERLHEWLVSLEVFKRSHGREEEGEVTASTPVVEAWFENVGATIMGRNMFGPPAGGPWGADPWQGWWGEEPPFHVPVFVLTHHAREPLEMEGGTTFHFVTDGIESALEQARETAAGQDVALAGGAEVARQYLAAGLLDEISLDVVPLLLGAGERLFEDVGTPRLEQVRAVEAPGVTHLEYRVG
jgi:dihydrofolate reductase